MHSMKIKRPLPPAPAPTRPVKQANAEGWGKYIKVVKKPTRPIDLRPKRKTPKTPTPNKATVRRLENTKKVLELYDKGYTADQIMCETGLARTTVDRYIRAKYGRRYRRQFQHDAKIIEMHEDGVLIDEIGRRLGVPSYYVDNILKRLHANGEVGRRYKEWTRKSSE